MSVGKAGVPDDVWTYDRFKVDEVIGSSTEVIEEDFGLRWEALYRDSQRTGALPYGMANLIAMRAYSEVVKPRPPGNIHAAQFCELSEVPVVSRELRSEVSCIAKYIKRERKMIEFRVAVSDVESARLLCESVLTICWAQ